MGDVVHGLGMRVHGSSYDCVCDLRRGAMLRRVGDWVDGCGVRCLACVLACVLPYRLTAGACRLQAFDDFMTAAACSFTLTVNDEEKPQIEQSSCPTAVVGTKGLPPWPELAASDNSGDEVDIKALVRRHGRDGLVTTEVTAESALTGAHSYTFRGASTDATEAHVALL